MKHLIPGPCLVYSRYSINDSVTSTPSKVSNVPMVSSPFPFLANPPQEGSRTHTNNNYECPLLDH